MRPMRPAAAMLVAAIFLGSCGSSETPQSAAPSTAASAVTTPGAASPTSAPPSAAPSPSPSPSPSAVDASEAFNDALADPLFEARITVTGVTEAAGMQIPMEGTIDVSPGGSHSVMTVSSPAGKETTESITYGGRTYELQSGAWVDTGPADTSGDLATAVRELGGFKDTGVETKNGASLHHMELPAGTSLSAAALGLDDPAMSNVVVEVEAWAEEDGTPVVMAINASWDQAVGESTLQATLTTEMAFSDAVVDVSAPETVWTWYTSTVHKYTIAYPTEWDVRKGTTKRADYYNNWDGSWYSVFRVKRQGFTLNSIASAVAKNLGDWTSLKGAKLDSNKPYTLDGVKARRLTFHGSYQGDRMWGVTILSVKGAYLYSVEYYLYEKPTDADLAQFETFAGTFSFK